MKQTNVIELAKKVAQNCIILDTETTGLDQSAEICEISIINSNGDVLFDTLVKPKNPIPDRAIEIHGITNEMVANAPSFLSVSKEIEQIIKASPLGIYNFQYDTRILRQCAKFSGFFMQIPDSGFCVMNMLAEYRGEWNDYYQNWRWIKLTEAANITGYKSTGKAHRALEDCKMTLHVLTWLASQY